MTAKSICTFNFGSGTQCRVGLKKDMQFNLKVWLLFKVMDQDDKSSKKVKIAYIWLSEYDWNFVENVIFAAFD